MGIETYEPVQTRRHARSGRSERSPRRTPRPYALRGLPYCRRRMKGSWNNDAAYYRCVFLSQYAAKNKTDHPKAVYLREDQLLPSLDRWLAGQFSPHALPQTGRER